MADTRVMDLAALFEGPPPPPCSHRLTLTGVHGASGIFAALLTLLKAALARLHADADGVVDLSSLTDTDAEELRRYFAALCIELRTDVDDGRRAPPCEHDEPRLADHVLRVHLPDRSLAVSFDYMRSNARPDHQADAACSSAADAPPRAPRSRRASEARSSACAVASSAWYSASVRGR